MFKDYFQSVIVDCHGQVRESYLFALVLLMTLNIILLVSKFMKKLNPKSILMRTVFKLAVKEDYLDKKIKEACVDLHKFKDSGIEPLLNFPNNMDTYAITERLEKIMKLDSQAEFTGKVGTNYYAPYFGGHKEFVCKNAGPFLYTNTMHFDNNKGTLLLENEVITWLLELFNAPKGACGTLTSGGTESIFQACVAYREIGKLNGIKEPEMIINESTHVGFLKAGFYLGLKIIKIPIDQETGLSKLDDFKNAIGPNTVAIVCSGGNYGHGLIDQAEELNNILKNTDIWIAIDSCLGGFTTSISQKIGDNRFPILDFRLERVGTISVDPHKYGEGPKGCSVILYRNELLKKATIYVCRDWTGGVYATSTLAGSRGAAPMVGSWISLAKIGLDGFIDTYKLIISTTDYLKSEISKIDELKVIGNPMACGIAFKWKNSDKNTLKMQLALSKMDWCLPSTQRPIAIRITITRANIPKLRECFIQDLKEGVKNILEKPGMYSDSFATMLYGTLLKVPDGEFIDDCLKNIQLHTSKISVDQ